MVGGSVRDDAYGKLRVIKAHEEAHVDTLGGTIEDLGGDPVAEPEFDFGTATVDPVEFLATAATLETTDVAAYAGAAPLIENAELISPALDIHSVEARHSSFLNGLNRGERLPGRRRRGADGGRGLKARRPLHRRVTAPPIPRLAGPPSWLDPGSVRPDPPDRLPWNQNPRTIPETPMKMTIPQTSTTFVTMGIVVSSGSIPSR